MHEIYVVLLSSSILTWLYSSLVQISVFVVLIFLCLMEVAKVDAQDRKSVV